MSKTAYPNTATAVSITLYCNIPFDNTYKHHPLISSEFKYNSYGMYGKTGSGAIPSNESFLDRKDYSQTGYPYVYQRWTLTDVFNFDFKNGLLGSITLELTNAQTNANYMKVVAGTQTWFYFITGITQSNIDTYTLSLELDVLTTYQDEFLVGMKDVPVFTKRKHSHRYTDNGLMPYCADLKTGEDAFAGVKPSLVKQVEKLHFKNSEMKKLENLGIGTMWLYVCCDFGNYDYQADTYGLGDLILYSNGDKTYPLIMVAIPLNVQGVSYYKSDNTCVIDFSRQELLGAVSSLIGEGSVHGCKISPYPPFSIDGANQGAIDLTSNILHLSSPSVVSVSSSTGINIYKMTIGGSTLVYGKWTNPPQITGGAIGLMLFNGGLIVGFEKGKSFPYDDITPTTLGIKNNSAPTIQSARFIDPKLLFSPFRRYKLNAQYESDGVELYPELIYSEYPTETGLVDSYTGNIGFETTATAYIGDNNFYTKPKSNTPTFNNYQYEKIGLCGSVNYIFPCGTNALDVFNSTSASTFYQSKTASEITAGLTIAGGVASVGLGLAGMIGTLGLSTPLSVGMIATGSTAIATGTASLVNNIKSVDAKIEDLKNTPNSINISGSNYITDECITANYTGLPYIVVYDVLPVIKENANDFFYNYGYQVARQCYFNTELKYTASTNGKVDNNLFGRTLFNYIQIQEDITNKINADIPYIAKKKLSSIFNEGITLWSFFGLKGLWDNYIPTSTEYVERYLFKNYYDNTEYSR